MSFFSGGFGDIVGGIAGLAGGLLGGHQDRNFARAQSEADRNFQREVFQNQYQWKAEDARKAGLHPLAVIGGGSYSASPSSVPASSMAGTLSDSLGKLGEGIGDSFVAYMSRDEIKDKKNKEEAEWNSRMKLLDAQIQEINARTRESLERAQSYSRPMASGRERITGQTDSRDTPFSNVPSRTNTVVTPAENVTGSSFAPQAYDINLTTEAQQLLGDEAGQVYNMLRKATRENRGYYRDPASGIELLFDRDTGYWYIPKSGGGGV